MSATPTFLTEQLYQYLLAISVRENDWITQLNQKTCEQFNIAMQSSPETLNFLGWFVEILNIKNILEVGTFTGLSALAMAQRLANDGKIICLDHSQEFTALAQEYWQKAGVENKIELKIGDALSSEKALLKSHKEYFDFIFIDADKINYLNHYQIGLQLLRPGGIIAIDNVLWKGKVIDKNEQHETTIAIRELNTFIHQDQQVSVTALPIGDGLTLVKKR